MSALALRTLLVEAAPAWHGVDAVVLAAARQSTLGRRLLLRGLASEAPALFAPAREDTARATLARWPRSRVGALVRDLGTLAFAPAIRAETRREPVRRLKALLGEGYPLALDRTVWDPPAGGDPAMAQRLDDALADDDARVVAELDAQGRAELARWAADGAHAALADWARLLGPRGPAPAAVLADAVVARVHAHHQQRGAA